MESNSNTTKYQGKKRCFGEFNCSICNKAWKSANSYANEYQQCSNCQNKVFPYKQRSLQSLYENLRKNKPLKILLLQEASGSATTSSTTTNTTTNKNQ